MKMARMVDSSPLMFDPAALGERIRHDGYLLVRGLLEDSLVYRVGREILDTVQRAGWLSSDTPPDRARVIPLREGIKDRKYWVGYAAMQGLESLHRLAHEPRLKELMRFVIGDDAYCYPAKSPYVMFPKVAGGKNTGPHQEAMAWTVDIYSTWIALAEIPLSNGPLAILPGSHSEGFRQPVPDFGPEWVTEHLVSGDVIVFHNYTVHGSLPNYSTRLRLSCAFKWQSMASPAPRIVTRPSRYPKVPDWDVLTDGWSSRSWIETPAGAKIR